MKNLEVGSTIKVKVPDGVGGFEHRVAKIRRIGEPASGGFRMATLDIGGGVAYCVVREEELAGG